MQNTDVRPTDVRGPSGGAEALIREARRRQWRRQLTIGLSVGGTALLTLTAIAAVHSASHKPRTPSHQIAQPNQRSVPPSRAGAMPGTTVVMWPAGGQQDSAIKLDNLATNTVRRAAASADPGEFQPIMLAGDQIVSVTAGGVQATNLSTGRTRLLGAAVAAAPSAVPGDIWLEYHHASSAAVTVRLVSVATGRSRPAIALPRGTWLVAGTAAGMVLQQGSSGVSGPFWRWTPGAGLDRLPGSRSSEGFAVSSRLIAYGTQCTNPGTSASLSSGGNFGFYACRTLRVLTVASGALQSFAAPRGSAGWVPTHGGNWAWSDSEIAPSGRLMAAQAVRKPASHGVASVYLLRLGRHPGSRSAVTNVPSSAAFLLGVTAWSRDGSTLYYQGPGQHLWAYHPRTGVAQPSGTSCCQYAVMATITGR